MKTIFIKISILLFLQFLVSCSPKQFVTGEDLYEKDNQLILKNHMSDSLYQTTLGRQIKRSNRLVKTEEDAFQIARLAFLKHEDLEYVKGRLYAFYLLNGFWIVKGMLPSGYTGGTLVAVIDSESGELIFSLIWR